MYAERKRKTSVFQMTSINIFQRNTFMNIYYSSLCVCVSICLPNTPYEKRQFFKLSLKGWNSEFFFYLTGCYTKVKEPCLSKYLPIAEGSWMHIVPNSPIWNAINLVQLLNSCHRFHFLWRQPLHYERARAHTHTHTYTYVYIYIYIYNIYKV